MKEKKKIVKGLPKRIRAFVLALVMVCTLLPMTAMTAYATNYSNCRWDITTNGGVISSVKFSFNTTDTASGTWKLYLWDKADTSGPNARPAILSESSLTTVNGSHVMELHYNGQAGHEYSVAMCLKDSNWSTQTHNVVNEPYVERICDWYGLDAKQLQGDVYLDGGKSENTVSEVFGQLSSGKAAAAPKEFSFNYAADCQRSPAYPKKGDSFTASGFGNPLNGNETFADRMEGNWKLISKGLYTGNDADYPGNYGLGDVISSAASVYGVNVNEIEVFELQESGKHIAYGVLCSAFEGTALYIGDTWSGGGGYVLSNVNLNSENEVSGTITNDVSTGFEEAPLPTGHTHGAWEYTANGATLTAECKAEGTCTLPENKVSLTLTAKSQSYSGNQVSASIDSAAWQNAGIEVPTIMYVGNGTTTYPESEAAPVAVGTYTAMITAGNKTAATNFEITKADASITVAPTARSLVYTGEAQELVTAGFTSDGTLVYSTAQNGEYSAAIPVGTDAGEYSVWYKVIGDANHTDARAAEVKAVIAKKEVTVSGIKVADKTYDATTRATVNCDNARFAGLVQGDSLYVTAKGSFSDKNVGSDKNVIITDLWLGGESVHNYRLAEKGNQTSATAAITAKDVTVTITPNGGTYADTITGAAAVINELIAGDAVTPVIRYSGNNYANGAAVPVNAGTYTVTVTLSGTDADNYNLTGATTADFVIAKAEAALSVTPDFSKTYGDEAFALHATKATDAVIEYSVKSGNAVSVDEQGNVTVERAGTATITASVAENENYLGDSKDITVKVAKKNGTLAISKLAYEVTYGDEDFDIGEMISEGDADSAITFTGYDANVISVNDNGRVSIKAAGKTQIKVNRANGTNYNPAQEVIVSVNVVPKAITVTADDKMITYGDQDAELTYSNSTLVGGDTLDIQLQREAGADAGDYEITATQEDGANPNYDITFVSGNYKILKKDITNADVILDQALVENGKMQAQQVASVVIDGLDVTYDLTDNTGDTAGVYTLTITGNGNFTGMITKTFVIAPAANSYLATDDEDAFIMGQGTIAVSVQAIGVSADLVSDKGEIVKMFVESGEISAEDLAAVASGSNIEIVLTVKDASQTITPEGKALLEKGCVGYTVGQHLDLSLELIVNGDSRIITDTAEKLAIKVAVPEKLINKDAAIIRMFAIVRNHEGNVEILSTDYETAAQAVTFQTDRFSDYAIAYKDVKNKDYKPADTNTGVSPETGDNSCLMVWFMMSAIALAAVVVLLQEIKKRNRLERRK